MGPHAPRLRQREGVTMAGQLRPGVSIPVLVLGLGMAVVISCGPRDPQPPKDQPQDPLFSKLRSPAVNPPAESLFCGTNRWKRQPSGGRSAGARSDQQWASCDGTRRDVGGTFSAQRSNRDAGYRWRAHGGVISASEGIDAAARTDVLGRFVRHRTCEDARAPRPSGPCVQRRIAASWRRSPWPVQSP